MKPKPTSRKKHLIVRACAIPRKLPAPICGALAVEIRSQRIARGLSLYAVAKLAGLAKETVCLVERNGLIRKFDTAARISDVFGMELGLLVSRAARRF